MQQYRNFRLRTFRGWRGRVVTMEDSKEQNSVPNDEGRKELARFLKSVVCMLVLALMSQAFVVESCPVQGPSMLPTLHENERILVYKLPVLLAHLPFFSGMQVFETGDMIVFDSVDEANKRYIKRVIAQGPPLRHNVVNAAAGNPDAVTVRYEDDTVYVNNHRLDEPYLAADLPPQPTTHSLTLGPGEFYVLGDNRPVSKDSRYFDAVKDEQVVGKALLRFWPPSQFGLL